MSLQTLIPYLESNASTEKLFVITNLNWEDYEQILLKLENDSYYHLSYYKGILEIMAPSESHENISENIGYLINIFLEIKEINFWQLGSTTIKNKEKMVGKEPDKSYCFYTKKAKADLAIEVIYTSGTLKILDTYKELEIKEVWLWKNNQISIYVLRNSKYKKQDNSFLLPDLNISLIESLSVTDNILKSAKEFRKYYSK